MELFSWLARPMFMPGEHRRPSRPVQIWRRLELWITVAIHGAPCFLGTLITWGQPLATPMDWTLRVAIAWALPGLIAFAMWRRWCRQGHRVAGWWALLLAEVGWWLIHLQVVWTACECWDCWIPGLLLGALIVVLMLVSGWLAGRVTWSARPWLIGLAVLISGLFGIHYAPGPELHESPMAYAVAVAFLALSLFVGRGVWTAKRWGLGLSFVLAGWLVVGPHGFVNPLDSLGEGQPATESELRELWQAHWPAKHPAGGHRYRFSLSGYYLTVAVALNVEVHADGTGMLTVFSFQSPSGCKLLPYLVGDDHMSLVKRQALTKRGVDRIASDFERHGFWELADEVIVQQIPAPAPMAWGRRLGSGGMYHGPVWDFRGLRDGSPEQGVDASTDLSGFHVDAADKAAWRKLSKLATRLLELSEVRVAKRQL